MHRYAVINNQTHEVVNVILWDGITQWAPPTGHYVVQHDQCDIGDSWDQKKQLLIKPDRTQKD